MSVSTYIVAFVSSDNETYRKHAKVLRACHEAGIERLPQETAEYFGSEYPELYLLDEKLEVDLPLHEWQSEDGYVYGQEILVSEIPEGTYKIRIYRG